MPKIDNDKYIAVDRGKLVNALAVRNTTMSKFSKDIGRQESYLRTMVGRYNGINKSMILLLKSQLGIDYETIKPDLKIKQKKPIQMDMGITKTDESYCCGDKFVELVSVLRNSIIKNVEALENEIISKGGTAKLDDTGKIGYGILKAIKFVFQSFDIDEEEKNND